MKIYRHPNRLFVELDDGSFGEVSPLAGRNRETIEQAYEQLLNPKGKLFPSVEFALTPLPQEEIIWPTAAFLMGSASAIMRQAENFSDFTTAKVKVGNLSVRDAIAIVQELKVLFRLRIDINNRWTAAQTAQFCSRFEPSDFDYLEDPPEAVPGFPIASDDLSFSNPAFIVWKPTVRGIPPKQDNLILGSSWESGIGLANIVRLAHLLGLPKHPLGIGTYHFLQDDFLNEPLKFSKGNVTIPAKLRPRC